MPNGPKTLRNLRLNPGAAYMKTQLNTRRPRIVNPRNLFPGVNPPPQAPVYPVTPTRRVSPQNMFPGPKEPSAFNLTPQELRLTPEQLKEHRRLERIRLRQRDAAEAAERNPGANYALPLNESLGGEQAGPPELVVGGRKKHKKCKRATLRKRTTLRLRK